MKNYGLVLFFLLVSLAGFSQRTHSIVLQNGSEIRGRVQSTDEEKTSILLKDGSIMVYKSEEIASIERYVPKVSSTGAFMRASLGLLGGEQLSPSFLLTNGYSFSSHWDLGLTVGVEPLWWDLYAPIMVSGRFNLLSKHYTPFVEVVSGYEMPFSNWEFNKGGFTAGSRIGFTKYLGNRVGFSSSIGYRFAHLVQIDNWWDDFRTIRQINRFDLRLEFTFK